MENIVDEFVLLTPRQHQRFFAQQRLYSAFEFKTDLRSREMLEVGQIQTVKELGMDTRAYRVLPSRIALEFAVQMHDLGFA